MSAATPEDVGGTTMGDAKTGDATDRIVPQRGAGDLEAQLAALREECVRLRERADRYRNFVELSSEGIWCFAFDPPLEIGSYEEEVIREAIRQAYERGKVIECNDAFARMYGYGHAEDLLGTPLADLVSPKRQENIDYLRQFILSGFRLEDGESHEIDCEGNAKYFLNNLIGIIEKQKLQQVWGTQRDITAHKQLEEQLRQAQKMEAVGQIAGGIAHDFNNMLTVIGGALELIADDMTHDASFASTLQDANRAVDQATALTRQLLAFSRRHVVRRSAVDVNEVVSDVARMMRRVIRETIAIETRLAPGLPPAAADRVELDQALVNLVLNARDAVGEAGSIVIETLPAPPSERPGREPARGVLLKVSDTGHGMDPDTSARVFEPFFTTKGAASGTGLGLSMVYAAITKSGGSVWVESEKGQGTTFSLRLAVAEDELVRGREPQAGERRGGRPATVLLVEDQADVRRLVRRSLESAGYTVLEAAGAEEAVNISRREDGYIDLLLSDVVMPGRNGLDLARALKRDRPTLRVMLMTGYADMPEDVGRDLLREARVLPKPFTRAHLEREVRAALSGWTPDSAMSPLR